MQNIDWHVKIQMLQNIKYLPMKDKQQQQQKQQQTTWGPIFHLFIQSKHLLFMPFIYTSTQFGPHETICPKQVPYTGRISKNNVILKEVVVNPSWTY